MKDIYHIFWCFLICSVRVFFAFLFSLKCFQKRKLKNPGGVDQGLGEGLTNGSLNDQKMVKGRVRVKWGFGDISTLCVCGYCLTSTSLASHVSWIDLTRLMWGMLRWRSEQAWQTNTPKVSDAQSGSAGESEGRGRKGGRGEGEMKEEWHSREAKGVLGRKERRERKWKWSKQRRRMIKRMVVDTEER